VTTLSEIEKTILRLPPAECERLADAIEVTVFRREGNWAPVVLDALESALELGSIGLVLSLAQIYEGEAISGSD